MYLYLSVCVATHGVLSSDDPAKTAEGSTKLVLPNLSRVCKPGASLLRAVPEGNPAG